MKNTQTNRRILIAVPSLFGLDKIAFADFAKLLNTPPTTAARPMR